MHCIRSFSLDLFKKILDGYVQHLREAIQLNICHGPFSVLNAGDGAATNIDCVGFQPIGEYLLAKPFLYAQFFHFASDEIFLLAVNDPRHTFPLCCPISRQYLEYRIFTEKLSYDRTEDLKKTDKL